MIKGLKDRDFIKDTFGRYVSKQVAEAILNGRLELGGERKRATVLISDIRNFTAISEKFPPEEVVDFLNEYFSEMVSVVIKYEGTLDKFIGDALLAVFGAPIAHPDDAKRAVFAALEMQEKLKEFNKKRVKKGKNEIRIGIAVHTGNLVAGNIGSEVRMEYTVIGDTVNLTSRLEPLNKQFGTQILISESTYSEVKDDIEVREIPAVELRGKEEKVKIYDVLGKKSKFLSPPSS
jgi:adenylate cyclase